MSLEVTIFMNYDVDYKGLYKGKVILQLPKITNAICTEFVHNKVLPNIHFKRNDQQEKERLIGTGDFFLEERQFLIRWLLT